jgi:23S rRNA (guanine1835-N2)-methyltransferase
MKNLTINRVPESTNNSLKAYSAADELLISYLEEKNPESVIIYNDSFGYLAAHSAPRTIYLASDLKSQEKAAIENFEINKLDSNCLLPTSLLKKAEKKAKLGLMKIPKSLGLFEMFLHHSASNMFKTGSLACGFMTRNFTKQMLEIASEYFEVVEQSLSQKKARLLILSKPKNVDKKQFLNTISFKNEEIKQYFGVFSSNHIDYATQFLIENLEPPEIVISVLDLACGNGILAKEIHKQFPEAEYHLVDDSQLAIESAKLNLKGDNVHFYHNNNLEDIPSNSLDYIVSNPPFHVEYEIDISLPLRLFRAAEKKLTKEGKFQVVANTHLNYKPHLEKIFKMVKVVFDNDKFIVYSCFNAYPEKDKRWKEDAI